MAATSLNIYAMCDAAWLPSHVINFFVAIVNRKFFGIIVN
jgi:hypothetical protein